MPIPAEEQQKPAHPPNPSRRIAPRAHTIVLMNHNILQIIVVTFVLLRSAGAQELPKLPPPPFWHFTVRSADKTTVTTVFPKDWSPTGGVGTYTEDQFEVQRSSDIVFERYDVVPGPYLDIGTAYVALDGSWSGDEPPYYRVFITKQGKLFTESSPMQPLEQAGSSFVVNGSPTPPGTECGDLTTSPCPDMRSALASATPGTTIYVTPGIYTGPANTNLTYAGKAITVDTTNGPSLTMINCTDPTSGKKTRAFSFKSGEGRDSILSGITIASGAADTGGCVSITNGSPTIRNALFFSCNATTGVSRGGAIYAVDNPAPGPLVTGTSFIFNWGVEGAAIFVGGNSNMDIEGCSFEWGICPTATGRGGAVCAVLANITVKDTLMKNGITGFGGGGIMVERGSAVIDGLIANNNTAGNFGGAFLLFGAEMKISNSEITDNRGSIFAGGVIITSSVYEATNTIHTGNYGRVGGGAVKVVGGQAKLKNCKVNGNTAGYGAGFDIAKQGDLSSLFTEVLVEDSEVIDNAVPSTGAGFHLDSYDSATFSNVLFKNNTATKGGGGWCNAPAPNPAVFVNVTFEENTAQIGGGLFVDVPCRASLDGVIFRRNAAVESGAGLATGNGVVLNITRSVFEANGVSDCKTAKPPLSGGGIMIGVEQFQINQQCGAPLGVKPAQVKIKDSLIVGNLALQQGGGISIEAGVLDMEGVEVESNTAVGTDGASDGIGGGVAVIERCPAGAPCTVAVARIKDGSIFENFARSAGGGLHYAGGSKTGSLNISRTAFTANSVEYEQNKANPEDGVGGGIFLGRSNFTISDISLSSNEAFYGGGIFFAADLNPAGAKLARISATSNRAVLGAAAYWLRSESPRYSLPVGAFSIKPEEVAAVATEVLQANYTTQPPAVVQSAEDISTFSVALLDYYGNVGSSELGSCQVNSPDGSLVISSADVLDASAPAPDLSGIEQPLPGDDNQYPVANNDTITIRPLGSEVGVGRGVAVFSQLEVTGMIGASYDLQVDCTPNSLGRSPYLQLSGQHLPPLYLPVKVSTCTPGREPKLTGSGGAICVDCPFNTFNVDGEACVACPKGALCPGGDQISSEKNYWRSNYNSTNFYSCRAPDVCNAGPVVGDAACIEGSEGPLCAVCREEWFPFGGECRSCNNSGMARAMLAIAIILIVSIVVLIFARSWDFGDPRQPGIMTKLKIVITHFQILALFRDYDLLWPSATSDGFAWFDIFNIGMGMMAPACFYGSGYSFWVKWIFQMLLPVGALGLCVAVYLAAEYFYKRELAAHGHGGSTVDGAGALPVGAITAAEVMTADGPSTQITEGPSDDALPISYCTKRAEWLAELKIRCWKNAFWLVTLLYPRCTLTALQMFGTQKLDIGTFLTADYSILVKSPGGGYESIYIKYMIPGAIMLIIFAIVVPGFWFWAIWRNKDNLEDPTVGKKYGFLYGSYIRRLAYWETIEALRKFAFAFIPVFIPVNSVGSVQGTVGQIVACGFLMATIWLRPYAKPQDNDLTIASMVVLWLVLLSGCTAKWANLNDSGLKGLAATQLILSSAVAFACIAAIIFSVLALVKRSKAKKAAAKAKKDDPTAQEDEDVKKSGRFSSFLTVKVRAGGAPGEDDTGAGACAPGAAAQALNASKDLPATTTEITLSSRLQKFIMCAGSSQTTKPAVDGSSVSGVQNRTAADPNA